MVTAWSRHGHGVLSASRPLHRGTITARSLHGHGTVTAWVRYVHGMGMAWERQWHGTVTASSRCRRRGSAWDGSGPLRLPARKNVVCVCVCVCARARVRVCVRARVTQSPKGILTPESGVRDAAGMLQGL